MSGIVLAALLGSLGFMFMALVFGGIVALIVTRDPSPAQPACNHQHLVCCDGGWASQCDWRCTHQCTMTDGRLDGHADRLDDLNDRVTWEGGRIGRLYGRVAGTEHETDRAHERLDTHAIALVSLSGRITDLEAQPSAPAACTHSCGPVETKTRWGIVAVGAIVGGFLLGGLASLVHNNHALVGNDPHPWFILSNPLVGVFGVVLGVVAGAAVGWFFAHRTVRPEV
ncbi:MAG: hypothetical protein JWN01_565 [Patescibacteria group bacterium]|nr:hypothetical protein [Patescibacteria group bacterium]